MNVKERIEALQAQERRSYGAQLARIRRQIAMLTEDQRRPEPLPKQAKKFA
jgi:hypothetical protein